MIFKLFHNRLLFLRYLAVFIVIKKGNEIIMDANKILLIVLAIFLPPVAVFLKKGVGKDLLINIILCLLFFFPGVLHAIWVVIQD